MKLSVIIVNYNVRHFLELCLHSVTKAIENLDAEIIVVDNNSTDNSLKLVQNLYPSVKLLINNENVGFSKANNQGAEIALGKYLCILNPDTVVSEKTFKNFLQFAEKQEKLGIIGCRLIDGAGKFLPESKRNIPTMSVSFKKLFGWSKSYYANEIPEHSNTEAKILVGAIMFLKKSVYSEVNGFDEDYFMYAEDVDLSYKVLKAEYKNYYLGKESIIHFKGESTIKDFNYLKRFYGSMQIFYKKHFRKSIVFDALVWLGIRIMPILKSNNDIHEKITDRTVIISDYISPELKGYFKENLEIEPKQNSARNNTTYIFNVSSISYNSIIHFISDSSKAKNVKFRFYMPESEYVVGSDNSQSRGEVIIL